MKPSLSVLFASLCLLAACQPLGSVAYPPLQPDSTGYLFLRVQEGGDFACRDDTVGSFTPLRHWEAADSLLEVHASFLQRRHLNLMLDGFMASDSLEAILQHLDRRGVGRIVVLRPKPKTHNP